MGTTVDEIMSRHVMTVEIETKLPHALHVMEKYHFKSLPVVDGGNRLKGVVSREDIIRALSRCTGRTSRTTVPLVARAGGHYAIA